MDDLAQWIGEQLDEDERLLRQALDFVDAGWRVDVVRNVVLCPLLIGSGRRQPTAVTADRWRYPQIAVPGLVPHVAEHDPARVLREIEAKREIVRDFQAALVERDNVEVGTDTYHRMVGTVTSLRRVICGLAAAYSHRPGFKEEWRP